VASQSDQVSPDEIARRAAMLSTLQPLKEAEVSPSGREAAIVAMKLPPPQEQALATDVANGRRRLVWMSLFDSDAEDGDVVTVSSGGLSQTLRLTKAPVAIALPAPDNGFVRMTGTVDGGGGGVTVGIVGPLGPMPLAVLSVGQTISVPVGPE
jgi:hypothetical protein